MNTEKITPLYEALSEIEKAKDIITKESENNTQKWTPEPITPDMLPLSIREWVEDVCERINSPFEIGAVSALCFIGNLIGSKVGMSPKQLDNWTVVPNLWGMIIGKPSIKKTPVYNELFKSIARLQNNAFKEFENDMQKVNEEHQKIDAEIRKLEKAKDVDMDKIIALRNSKPSTPKLKRYTTQDATIEAIAKIIKDNPEGLLITQDELSGLLNNMSKKGHEADRTFYLEGWNGLGSRTIDRAGSGIIHLPCFTLGILGSIQPSMIKEYVMQTVSGKKDDGFLQRFQLAVYAEPMKPNYIDRHPNKTARKEFDKIIDYITTNDDYLGAQKDDYHQIPFYRFNDDAQEIFIKWYIENSKEAESAPNEALMQHLSKYDNLFISLCLIFHICDIAGGRNFDYTRIDKRNAQRALELTNALKSHAYRLYSTFEIEEEKREAISDKILLYLSGKTLPIKFREINKNAGGKPKADVVKRAVQGRYICGEHEVIKRIAQS